MPFRERLKEPACNGLRIRVCDLLLRRGIRTPTGASGTRRPRELARQALPTVGGRRPRPGIDARAEIDRLNGRVADELTSFIQYYSHSEKFKHVMNLVALARFHVWSSLTPPTSDSGCVFSLGGFPRAYSGQVVRYSEELVKRLLRGLERVSNNPVHARMV
jgi:hypothetical protein